MKLYEINQEIENLIDEETGEITDLEKFNQLQETKEQKFENVSLYVKNTESDINAIKEEISNLQARLKAKTKRAEGLKWWLSKAMLDNNIKKIDTPKAKISFRNSKQVIIDDEEAFKKEHPELFSTKTTVVPNKTKIKEWLKDNISENCHLEEKQNLQIK